MRWGVLNTGSSGEDKESLQMMRDYSLAPYFQRNLSMSLKLINSSLNTERKVFITSQNLG